MHVHINTTHLTSLSLFPPRTPIALPSINNPTRMICLRPKHPHTHTHTHPTTETHQQQTTSSHQYEQIHNLLLAALFLPPTTPTNNFPLYKHLTHAMETPTSDIAYALTRILNAPTPQSQLASLRRYFTPDASLVSPLCWIPSSPTSRDRVIRAFVFLRIVTSGCESRVRRQAFNDVKGKMSLEMEVRPLVRGARWVGCEGPAVPCHVFLEMVRGVAAEAGGCGAGVGTGVEGGMAARVSGQGGILGVWRVRRCEVVVQPVDILHSLKLTWLSHLLYYLLYTTITLVVLLGEIFHIWSTSEISLLGELCTLAQDGLALLLLSPLAGVWSALTWSTNYLFRTAKDAVRDANHENRGRVWFLKHAARLILWRIVQQLVGPAWGVAQIGGAVGEGVVQVGGAARDTAVQVGGAARDTAVQFGTAGRDATVQVSTVARDSAHDAGSAARDATIHIGAASRDGVVRVGAASRDGAVRVGAATKDAEGHVGTAVHEVAGKQVGSARVHLPQAL